MTVKKHIAKALDFKFDKPEPFALEVQTATDHERAAAEAVQREKKRKENEAKQLQLQCTHNSMVAEGTTFAWKCAQCGFIYERK